MFCLACSTVEKVVLVVFQAEIVCIYSRCSTAESWDLHREFGISSSNPKFLKQQEETFC